MCACVCRCRESRGAMERVDTLFIPAAGTPTRQGRHSLDKDRQTSIEGALAIVSRIDDVLSTLKAAGPADTHGWGSSGAKLCWPGPLADVVASLPETADARGELPASGAMVTSEAHSESVAGSVRGRNDEWGWRRRGSGLRAPNPVCGASRHQERATTVPTSINHACIVLRGECGLSVGSEVVSFGKRTSASVAAVSQGCSE